MKTKEKFDQGITLVALVVTIIILLILAGISIQGLTHTGMFESVYKAKLETKRGQIEEWLTLKVIEEQANSPTENADKIIPKVREKVIKNIGELQKIGKVEEKDVTETSTEENFKVVDIYFYVTVDEDIYKVNLKEQKFIGQVGKMIPTIRLDNIYSKTSEITVKVSTQNNEGGKLEYFIKSEDENNYIKKDTLDSEINQEYTYKGLMQNKKYSIKIVAESKGKQTAQVFGEASTGKIEVATEGTYKPTTWTNGKVIVTLPTKNGYSTLYTTDGTLPTNSSTKYTKEFEVSNNTTINYSLSDGTNIIKMGTLNVLNIDTEAPNAFTPTVTSTTNSITVTAQTSDKKATITNGESGIEGYRFSKDNGKTWTEYQENGEYTFNDMLKSIDGSTYDIVVQAKDKAQNVVSTKIKASTTKNMDYYIAEKNMLLCTFMPEGYTRDFYKYNDGGAIAAIQYTKYPEDAPDGIGLYKWYNPMLVSTKSENVIYYARNRTGEESGANPKLYGQFVYKDVTYYHSIGTWSVAEVKNYITTLKLLNVNDQPFIETTVDTQYRTAAIALIKKYLGE